tara:strand:+ start:1966 stop:2343 length:378 start_codon:yes stop_codon:yes gene_type:complete
METLNIPATDDTPEVILDASGDFQFNGKSLPEDVASFYDPIIDWIDSYGKNPLDSSIFKFKFTYFNTASSKMILDILMKLEELSEGGADIKVEWHYEEEDEDMEEAGEEYSDIVEVPFEMVAYED